MTQTAIPFLFMRGGTSRGPYFLRSDLPEDRNELSSILLKVMGTGNEHNIDGIGGGNSVTTKVAMLSKSAASSVDVDYFFAQVGVDKEVVDYRPTCGNILVGVGPAALEMGLVPITGDATTVRIHAVNTGANVEAVVQTPNGAVNYQGNEVIDGVPGSAAPIELKFIDITGSKCGAMLPTGSAREIISGIEVTCIDVAVPMVIGRAADFGLSGYESPKEIDSTAGLHKKIEEVRAEAGHRMGLGDVTASVTPKFGLVSAPKAGGHFNARYFVPWNCHPTLAVTGSQCFAACALQPGSVLDGIAKEIESSPATVRIEHPAGESVLTVEFERQDENLEFRSANLVRTARLIARGEVMC